MIPYIRYRIYELCIESKKNCSFLLIFVSGIPLLEESGMIRYGKDPAYIDYVANVPVLIPFIGKRGLAMF